VISAGGIKAGFPAVTALLAASPKFERWQVTAFRPRRDGSFIITLSDKQIDPKDVQFNLHTVGKVIGICVFIPGYSDDDPDFKTAGYLLLDAALGEYDVETKIGPIKIRSPETQTEGERYPFSELPAKFDQLTSRLGYPGASAERNDQRPPLNSGTALALRLRGIVSDSMFQPAIVNSESAGKAPGARNCAIISRDSPGINSK